MSNQPASFIPDDQFIPDQAPQQMVAANSLAHPPSFIPDDQFKSDEDSQQEKYGTIPQQAIAAVEGLARGASLGTSDLAETRLGISSGEDIRGRQQANPATSFLGNVAGGAGLIAATGGLAAPIEAGVLGGAELAGTSFAKQAAARALGYGTEGALFGAGNTVSDYALGDTKINAQKILTDIGLGAAFGSGLGLLSKGIEAAPSLFRKSVAEAPESLNEIAGVNTGESAPVVDAPPVEPKSGINPTDLEEIQKRVDNAKYSNQTTELPAKGVLEDAASRVEMMNPIHPLQFESLSNQSARDLYKTALEMPGKEGDALRGYESLQKNELVYQTKKAIENIAPGAELTSDAVKGGENAIKVFTDQYQNEKNLLGPAFEELKKTNLADVNHLPGVLEKMTDEVPGVAKMFDTTGDEISIKPYKTSWGIDKATYSAVKQAVESLSEGPTGFEELANIRKGLDQHVDILAKGQAPQEIMALKKSMMDYMQDVLAKNGEGSDVTEIRELFKRYAINEQQRGVIEKAFGAGVGTPEFGQISRIKPEMISDKIFSNTATVNAAKNILPEEKFNHLMANWLSEQIDKVTDKGAFSSNKFGTFLKKNQDVLNEAFSNNPSALNKLKDLNNIMRILPDSVSVNPSGTAKTLLGILKAHSIGDLIGNLKGYAGEKLQNKIVNEQVNAHLAGKADQATKMSIIQKTIKKTSDKIDSGVKAIFSNGGRGGIISGGAYLSDKEYNDAVNRIKELSGNPTAMMDHMGKSTDALYAAAPNITQSLNNTMVAGLNFLASKIPAPVNHMPLSQDFVVSDAQKQKFNNYYHIVNDPISSLDQVKNNSITNETMEALSAVYPDLLGEMRQKLVENLNPEEAKNLNYAKKISLAKFLGQPLDENMLPQAYMSYQASLAGPQMSQQSAPKQSRQKSSVTGLKNMKLAERSSSHLRDLTGDEEI